MARPVDKLAGQYMREVSDKFSAEIFQRDIQRGVLKFPAFMDSCSRSILDIRTIGKRIFRPYSMGDLSWDDTGEFPPGLTPLQVQEIMHSRNK